VAHGPETNRSWCEVRTEASYLGFACEQCSRRVNRVFNPVGSLGIILFYVSPDFEEIVDRFRRESILTHPSSRIRRTCSFSVG